MFIPQTPQFTLILTCADTRLTSVIEGIYWDWQTQFKPGMTAKYSKKSRKYAVKNSKNPFTKCH